MCAQCQLEKYYGKPMFKIICQFLKNVKIDQVLTQSNSTQLNWEKSDDDYWFQLPPHQPPPPGNIKALPDREIWGVT